MTLIDSHCHFDFSEFDTDRDNLWQQCRQAGIRALVVPGVSPEQWQRAATLTQQTPGLFYAAGLHPWWVPQLSAQKINSYREQLESELQKHIGNPTCVAVGECGLDRVKNQNWQQQCAMFEWHLLWAQQFELPLIIHCVKAHNEMLAFLKKYHPARGGVIHGFSGSVEIARQYWLLGFYLGVGGTITYERANKTRQACTQMPMEALLLETDAPDMPLSGEQGQRNSPLCVLKVAQCLAQLRGESVEQIAAATTENTEKLFRLKSVASR